MKDFCNNVFRDLLARLGELSIQASILEKEMEGIKRQIELLNALSPQLQKHESDNQKS